VISLPIRDNATPLVILSTPTISGIIDCLTIISKDLDNPTRDETSRIGIIDKYPITANSSTEEDNTKKDVLEKYKVFLLPNRSTKTPKKGAAKVPVNLKAPYKPSKVGDPVS
tara:strand:- start:1233 stop:1568 length:336 start_codon:yes stop_codon:yes gene_type:complete